MRKRLWVIAGAAIAAVAGLAVVPASAGAGLGRAVSIVRYGTYTFEVPGSWPVIRLARHPGTCVRFDRHTIYLGRPAANESCPARLHGTTEALLVQPGPVSAARAAVENPVARRISVTAPGIRVTATYGGSTDLIDEVLRSAALPRPMIKSPTIRRVAASRSAPDLPTTATRYRGRGFDACTAPSSAVMDSWRQYSPYRAIGIYVGGSDRACAQPNLTRSWLRRQTAAGWHYIPLYVGPQAAYGELSAPAVQAQADAADAVRQAERLGFPAGTPIYYDMEAYLPGQSAVALRFLSEWTISIHRLGFSAGVYSSSLSGVKDLAQQYFRGRYTMPDVIYDALWNGRANAQDPVLGRVLWSGHRRLHQFRGNVIQTWGGDTIDIDTDYLNVNLPPPVVTAQASPSVREPRRVVDVFFRGRDRHLWRARYRPGRGWTAPADLGGRVRSAPSAVVSGRHTVNVFYQGTNGRLWRVRQRWGKAGQPRPVKRLGILGGGPAAVSEPGGFIDVVWHGSADKHAWLGRFRPASGWSGPRSLGGSLASAPSPVEPVPGQVEVFWKGTDRALWHVTSGKRGWRPPARLGMGPLGGAPRATAELSGATRVLWHGSADPHVWLATGTEAGQWLGPHSLGGRISLAPFPLAPPTGPVRVFWRGQNRRLWQVVSRSASGWRAPAQLPGTGLGTGPFATVGPGSGAMRVFWAGKRNVLWTSALRGGRWSKAVRLGGHLG